MSIGGPPLGTLLIQRLDAALGTTLSQQTSVVSGIRPDAVSQPQNPDRAGAAQNETLRHPRDAVDRATARAESAGRQAVDTIRPDLRRSEPGISSSTADTSSTPSAPTTLGSAAKAILALLAHFPDKAPAVSGKLPLADMRMTPAQPLPGPVTDVPVNAPAKGTGSLNATAPAFAQALSQALQGSGIFYESHLNNVAFGKQDASSVAREPQGQLGHQTAHAATRSEPAPASQLTSPLAGLHPETHLLVRQQLEVLANQSFAWQGEAWPDAPMEWDVARHPPAGADEHEDTSPDHWATRVVITMPNLGQVEARINLAGGHLAVHLSSTQSAQRLSDHSDILRSRYDAAGLQLGQLSIDAEMTHDGNET